MRSKGEKYQLQSTTGSIVLWSIIMTKSYVRSNGEEYQLHSTTGSTVLWSIIMMRSNVRSNGEEQAPTLLH